MKRSTKGRTLTFRDRRNNAHPSGMFEGNAVVSRTTVVTARCNERQCNSTSNQLELTAKTRYQRYIRSDMHNFESRSR